jgi:hypothetical protein
MENDRWVYLLPLFVAVLLSFVIERALAVIFDIPAVDKWLKLRGSSLKGIVAAALAVTICIVGDLDVVSKMLEYGGSEPNAAGLLGNIVTGVFIAGGSQASVKLFQDILGFSKEHRDRLDEFQRKEGEVKELVLEREALQQQAEIAQLRARIAHPDGDDISLDVERLARAEEAVTRINEARRQQVAA